MSRKLAPAQAALPRRRLIPAAVRVAVALVLALVVLVGTILDTRPQVSQIPDATAAQDAMAAGQTLRAFIGSGASDGTLALPDRQIDALLASASRLAPGIAGAAELGADGALLHVSLGAPWLPGGVWVNASVGIAAPADELRVTSARIGRLPLPPGLVQAGLARAVDRVLGGEGVGQALIDGVVGVRVADGVAALDVSFAPDQRAELVARIREGLAMHGDVASQEPLRAQVYWLHRLGAEGALDGDGSVAPYFRAIVERAVRQTRRFPDMPDRDLAAAGLLALALYCGEPALSPAIGVGLTETQRGANTCDGTTLAGRDDLKRHFSVSAGLEAASNDATTLGIGELKELMDSGEGGTGFSFDDMTANRSGSRFARAFLATPRAEWPALAALIRSEADVLPPVDDLPTGLTEAEFVAKFGAVDSPEYRAMMAEIERRIDALPLYRELARRAGH